MGLNLYYTIPIFFEDRMREHSNVRSFRRLPIEEEFIYEVERIRFADRVKIWLSDQYTFTDMDYHNRPAELTPGDYILIARPEAGGGASRTLISERQIGVGKMRELLGALTKKEMWKYVPPSDEERKKRRGYRSA